MPFGPNVRCGRRAVKTYGTLTRTSFDVALDPQAALATTRMKYGPLPTAADTVFVSPTLPLNTLLAPAVDPAMTV